MNKFTNKSVPWFATEKLFGYSDPIGEMAGKQNDSALLFNLESNSSSQIFIAMIVDL